MNLKERAIAEYEKEKKLTYEKNVKEAEIFADKAVVELQNFLGVRRVDIMTVDKQPCYTNFSVDDMLFMVSISGCYHVIDIIKRCDVCGHDTATRISNIGDIGRVLIEPHFKYDCEHAVEINKRNKRNKRNEKMKDGDEGGNELDVNKRLILALKDFVSENDMCSSIEI